MLDGAVFEGPSVPLLRVSTSAYTTIHRHRTYFAVLGGALKISVMAAAWVLREPLEGKVFVTSPSRLGLLWDDLKLCRIQRCKESLHPIL